MPRFMLLSLTEQFWVYLAPVTWTIIKSHSKMKGKRTTAKLYQSTCHFLLRVVIVARCQQVTKYKRRHIHALLSMPRHWYAFAIVPDFDHISFTIHPTMTYLLVRQTSTFSNMIKISIN